MAAYLGMGGSSWLSRWLFVLGLWYVNFSWVQPLECPAHILPSRLNEIFSSRQHGFTLTSKGTQFLHSYWLLQFKWLPSWSEGGWLLEIYCLLMYWMELVPILLAEEKPVSTDASEAILWQCSGTQDERDVVLLWISQSYSQPPLFHLPYIQEPFLPDVEQLILGQHHQAMDCGQGHLSAEKLCHLQERKVNLHRASWGQCIVAPKTFNFPSCQGVCLALDSELLHSNFECYKKEAPTCSRLFQACSPVKVRLFSLMIQDDEYRMSVHHVNTSLIEKCGCS